MTRAEAGPDEANHGSCPPTGRTLRRLRPVEPDPHSLRRAIPVSSGRRLTSCHGPAGRLLTSWCRRRTESDQQNSAGTTSAFT